MKNKHSIIGSLLLIFALILACSPLDLSLIKSSLGSAGRILYSSDQSGNFEIYLLGIKSSTPSRLTNNSSDDYSATYIPALQKIGFMSDRGEGINIYTMNIDGSEQTALFNKPVIADSPDWSPDGTQIIASFSENCKGKVEDCKYDIYLLDPITKENKQLTKTPQSEWVPQWSPDGSKIIFASDRDGDSEIYVMDKDGSNVVKLTDNKGHDGRHRWSPDGTMIAFETDRQGGDWDIFIMDADGKNPRAVTSNTYSGEWMQSWSPDGKWLVYILSRDGDNEIYIIDINGENQRKMTSNTFSDITPIWIP